MHVFKLILAITLALGLLLGLGVLVMLHPAEAAPTGTIQSQIDNTPNGGTVSIAAGTYTESLTVNKTLTLTGKSSGTTIIRAVTGQRVISVTEGNDLRLENLIVTGGQVSGDIGGGVFVISGSLTLVNCRIANNSADLGGGVFRQGAGGRVDAINSRIEFNTSLADGGGLFVVNGDVTLANAQVLSNTASGNGGGLVALGGGITLTNAQVSSNTAGGAGGGLFVLGGDVTATNVQVLSNTASSDGGGLFVIGGRVDLSGGSLGNNRALNGNGGAVIADSDVNISGTQFRNNTAFDGGGLHQSGEAYTVTLTNARFERNVARGVGGGAAISGTLIISHSTFVTNTVDSGDSTGTYGGGVYVKGLSQILASTFVGNSARCATCSDPAGGGVYTFDPATIQDSTFDRNAASFGGGVSSPFITVTRSVFKNNTAGDGGAIRAFILRATNSSFLNNQASNAGGGVWGLEATLSSTRFTSNTAGSSGGGVWALGNLDAVNTLLADNQASAEGAAINAGNAILRYVTVSGATLRAMPAIQIDGGAVLITDTIVSNYTVGISQTAGTLSADYNLFFTTTPTQTTGVTLSWGLHNLNADPKFINPAAGDYHLAIGSPAIDSGTDVGVTTDLAGLSRPRGKGFDMGAYEFQPPIYLPLIMR